MGVAIIDTEGHWMVNSSHIYIPAPDIQIQHTNVAGKESGRTEDGVMHIDWVRRDIVKVNLVYNAITGNEIAYMLGLMQGQEFDFTYLDFGTTHTISAYCGECNYQAYSSELYPSEGGLYTSFQINVIEM